MTARLEQISTGNESLDQILGGGIPTHSATVIAGEPGSGKTILTLQMMFHHARRGMTCLYFTTVSEPALKLIRYMQQFEFFDASLVDKRVFFVDLGNVIRKGADETLTEITSRIENHEPGIVAIDSFKAMVEMLDARTSRRSFVYDISVQIPAWGATALLVGEYQSSEIPVLPEFAVADGILRLGTLRQELTAIRQIEAVKLRGAEFVPGQHFFEIRKKAGIACFPRVRSPDGELPAVSFAERDPSGVAELDRLLGGGLPRASATVVQGPTGSGKTILALQFLVEGARRGERGVYFTLEEPAGQLRAVAANFGWDLAALEKEGLLVLSYASPVELSTDRYLNEARNEISRTSARRVVFDSMTSLSLGIASERRFRELVYALTKHVRVAGATLLTTIETMDLLGATEDAQTGISFAADNIVLMRYLEVDGRLERAMSVLKARGIRHSTELRAMSIGTKGIEVAAEKFVDRRGVLTGKKE